MMEEILVLELGVSEMKVVRSAVNRMLKKRVGESTRRPFQPAEGKRDANLWQIERLRTTLEKVDFILGKHAGGGVGGGV